MCWLIFAQIMLRFVYIIYIYFRAVKKNEFWIFVEFKIKIHIGKQRVCQWRTSCDEDEGRCRCIWMLLLACPVEHTGYIVHLKYCGRREHQCGVVYVKTGTKPFTQNAYLSHFLEGHLSALHSRLTKESWIFRRPFKMITGLTLKKHVSKRYGGTGLSPFHCNSCFKWKVTLLFVIGFPCFVLNCVYAWCNYSTHYSKVVVLFYALKNRRLVIFCSMRPLVASGGKPKVFFPQLKLYLLNLKIILIEYFIIE